MITSQHIAPGLVAQDETLLAQIRAGFLADPVGLPSLPVRTAEVAAAYLLQRATPRYARPTAQDIELCEQTRDVTELAHLAPSCALAGCPAAGEWHVSLPGTRERDLCTRHAARRIRRIGRGVR